jgi:hypothetical protein
MYPVLAQTWLTLVDPENPSNTADGRTFPARERMRGRSLSFEPVYLKACVTGQEMPIKSSITVLSFLNKVFP